jgi:hypothetical protein
MKKKIGRNDPCPCGSGKKYKNCCIGKYDNVFPFPGGEYVDDAFKKYQDLVESWDHEKGPPPTFMESMGIPNPATENIHDLSEMIGSREFRSEEELKAFIEARTEEMNRTPLDEFIGLSPDQMHSILHSIIDDNGSILAINSGLFATSVEAVPALLQCRYLLERVGESDKGLKATQKGNLPRSVVQDFYEVFVREYDVLDMTPMMEDDVKEIQKAKYFLRDSGFIKFKKGRFSVTRQGRRMLDDFDPVAFYLLLFRYFAETYNWLYGTHYSDSMEFLQASLPFCLYLIKRKAGDFVFAEELAEIYLNAFPRLAEDMEYDYGESTVTSGFIYLFLIEFAHYLGLAEILGKRDILSRSEAQFRTTQLFSEFLTWKM